MSVILTVLIGLLIVGGLLLNRIMGIFSIFDLFDFSKEKKIFDLYEDEVQRRRDRDNRL